MPTITGGLSMISQMLPNLPPSERKIAEYIIKNPKEAITCTANELGKRSSTSGAAVIRLCKSLGLKGFQELKLKIAGDLQKPFEEGYRDITPFETQESIIQKMTNNNIQTLRDTVEVLHPDELRKAVDALIQANTIHFFGIGASSIIAKDAQQKFLRINKNATAFTDTHLLATLIGNAKKDDVVFGISFSGETIEVANLLELAKQKGVKTISLTRYGISPVTEQADIRLYTSYSKEAVFRSGATSSRIAQLHVIDILFMCVATQAYEETIKSIDRTRDAIEFFKEKQYRKRVKTIQEES